MVLRFLGESVTDSNGLAVLPDGYTGTGAGEIDVVAKTEIDDSIFQSEPYQVLDCQFYDDGVTDPKTVTWYNQDSAFTLTPSSDGTLVSSTTSTNKTMFADGTGYTASKKFAPNTCAEVTIVSNESGTSNTFYAEANSGSSITINGSATLKLVWDGSKIDKYINGVYQSSTQNITGNYIAYGFRVNNGSFKFKDFMIYPI